MRNSKLYDNIKVDWSKYLKHNFTINIKNAMYMFGNYNGGFNWRYPAYFQHYTNIIDDFDDGDDYWEECDFVQDNISYWLEENFANVKNWNKINPKDYLDKEFVIATVDLYPIGDNDRLMEETKEYEYVLKMFMDEDDGRLYFNVHSREKKEEKNGNK